MNGADAARDVVRWRDAPAALYRQALDWTETACRLAPDDGACLTTRGIAQFRAGRDAEALATLARAERLNQGDDGERVADWAFLALAHHRLGHKDEATATLARLREALAKEGVGRTGEAQSFLAEAVAAIQGPDK